MRDEMEFHIYAPVRIGHRHRPSRKPCSIRATGFASAHTLVVRRAFVLGDSTAPLGLYADSQLDPRVACGLH